MLAELYYDKKTHLSEELKNSIAHVIENRFIQGYPVPSSIAEQKQDLPSERLKTGDTVLYKNESNDWEIVKVLKTSYNSVTLLGRLASIKTVKADWSLKMKAL